MTAPVFYLHGFASSARSTKAAFFAERFRARGVPFLCPDFNQPSFETLTMTRMLSQLEQAIAAVGPPVTLVGSSLGGTLAILAAARMPSRVERLVLLAPAVMFTQAGHHLLPPEQLEEWQRRGAITFFHHGYGDERPLRYSFHEDSLRYDAFDATLSQPAMIFQGRHDASVDYRAVEAFASRRPNVTLSLLDDDHQLVASLPRIWTEVEAFLGLLE